ncbi:recombinase family protein [Knoellia aerolata]|uniref:recombinase family protein n=1 Tax=Knoellia aerolata TaxID=442954 RepID=UPI0014700C18|nr:recombinase family protein [Knoellia aerolata]
MANDAIQRLLEGCDRGTDVGVRDFAIIILLARLGLRSIEVARLELHEVDWRGGELVVPGKGGGRDRLPLPAEVGEALVAYLTGDRGSRTGSGHTRLFLTCRAPRQPIRADLVGDVVERACLRAGLPRVGPHRLRHALAAELLSQGAGLVAATGSVAQGEPQGVVSDQVRVVTYARVSTAEQVEKGTSLPDQRRRLAAAVTARAAVLVEHFDDAGVSGALHSRPGLDRLLARVEAGGVDALMATKIDRISRSAVGLLNLVEKLREHGCHVVLIDEGLDTSTPAGDLTFGVLGVIGGWERRRISERTQQSRRAAAQNEGRFVSSTPPFGYRVVSAPSKRGKRLVTDDAQAETIRTIPTTDRGRLERSYRCGRTEFGGYGASACVFLVRCLSASLGPEGTASSSGLRNLDLRWHLRLHPSDPHPGAVSAMVSLATGPHRAATTAPRSLPAVRCSADAVRARGHGANRRNPTPDLLLPGPLPFHHRPPPARILPQRPRRRRRRSRPATRQTRPRHAAGTRTRRQTLPPGPNRANPTGVIAGWKNILNVLTMANGDRLVIN